MARRLALIIGNSEYEDAGLSALVTPGADVNALAGVLRDPDVGGFDEVTALVNQSAAAIQRAIAGFFAEREREDLLLLYFSGHGVRDERGQLFLAARDTEHRLLRGTAIASSFITEEMDSSRSRRQVLILDCCHSGAFSRGMKGTPGSSVGTAVAFEGTGSGRVVLTATDSTQYAWEGDQVIGQAENSVFTHYLIQGLRTGAADTDSDGRITLDELYDYVYDLVVNETPRQTPSKWSYGQQGEIVLARNPRPVVKPAELPVDLQETIEDPRPWVRESALRELERLVRGGHRGLALAARQAIERLTEDDSRRVAAAAGDALAALPETPAATMPAIEPARIPSESRMLFQKMSGTEPRVKPGPGAEPKTAERVIEQDIPARATEIPKHEKKLASPINVPSWSRGLASVAGNGSIRELAVITAVGTALSGALGTYYGWTQAKAWGFAINGLVGGAAVELALWYWRRSFSLVRLVLLCAVWGITASLLSWLDEPVAEAVSTIFGTVLSADISWKAGWWVGLWTAGFLCGGLGGLATGLALNGLGYPLLRRAIWTIGLGWAIGFGFMWVTGLVFGDWTDWNDVGPVMIGYAIGGLIAGAIGGTVMFLQLARRPEADDSLSMEPRLMGHAARIPAIPMDAAPQTAGLSWSQRLIAIWDSLMSRPFIVTALGHGLAAALALYFAWTISLPWGIAAQGLVLGATLGVVLWYRKRTFNLAWVALLIAATAASSALVNQIERPAADAMSNVLGDLIGKLGWWMGLLLAGLVSGSFLGGAVVLALSRSGFSVSGRALFRILLGWIVGFALMELIGEISGELTNWESLRAAFVGFGVGGLVGGAIGGIVMFSQLSQKPEAEKSLSPAPSR